MVVVLLADEAWERTSGMKARMINNPNCLLMNKYNTAGYLILDLYTGAKNKSQKLPI